MAPHLDDTIFGSLSNYEGECSSCLFLSHDYASHFKAELSDVCCRSLEWRRAAAAARKPHPGNVLVKWIKDWLQKSHTNIIRMLMWSFLYMTKTQNTNVLTDTGTTCTHTLQIPIRANSSSFNLIGGLEQCYFNPRISAHKASRAWSLLLRLVTLLFYLLRWYVGGDVVYINFFHLPHL